MAVDQATISAAGLDPFTQRLSALDRERETLSERDQALSGQKAALSGESERLMQARSTALAPVRAREVEQLHNRPPAAPPEEKVPSYERPRMDPKQFSEAFSMMMAASMLVGLGSRVPFHSAMAGITGAMEGTVKADHAAVQESLQSYDRNARAITERNAQLRRRSDDAYKLWERDFQAGKREYELIAAEYDDPIALNLAREGKVDAARKQLETRINSVDRAVDRMTTQRAQLEDKQEARADRRQMHEESLADRREARAERRADRAATSGADEFTQEDVKYWAEVLSKGGSLPPRLATTPGGKKLVADVMREVTRSGTAPAEMLANQADFMGAKAGSRTLGTRTANMGMAVNEANQMAELVVQASDKVNRTEYQPVNRALLSWEKNTGNTEVREYGAALNSFINAYARAISPVGVPTIADKEHARETLTTADSKEQVKAVIGQLKKEMTAAQKAPQQTREEVRELITTPQRRAGDGQTPRVSSKAEFDALPPGAKFIDARDGREKEKGR